MLTREQVTALTAQAARAANIYPSRDDAGNLLPGWQLNTNGEPVYTGSELGTRGVGVYGQSVESLILTGYLKPATLNLITTPELTDEVLLSSAVWTGQFGIQNLLNYLDSPILQNISQIALIAGSYQGLVNAGYLTGFEGARYQATLLQPAAKYGVNAVIAWVEGLVSPEQAADIANTARQGQFAIDFVDTYSNELSVAPDLPGFTNTVQRDEIDTIFEQIVGNPKIPLIEYVDIVEALVETTPSINQLLNTGPATRIPPVTNEDGQFRFSPGVARG